MKSCVMAGWLMTVSVGNAIVVIFAEARLTDNMVRTGGAFPLHSAQVCFVMLENVPSDTKIILRIAVARFPPLFVILIFQGYGITMFPVLQAQALLLPLTPKKETV